MSTITRALSGAKLSFDLAHQIEELRRDDSYVRSGRLGRTLVKDEDFRLTLTVLAGGADVGTHHAGARMTLQPLDGRLRYGVDGKEIEIGQGDVLFFGAGHARDVRALEDAALLLTIDMPDGEVDGA